MKLKLFALAGMLLLTLSPAQAASWVMVPGSNQSSLDQNINLDFGAANGTLSYAENPIAGTIIDADGFFAFGANALPFSVADGSNSIIADVSHEAAGSTDANADGRTAQIKINTMADITVNTQSATALGGNASIATRASQDFRILAGLGETIGDPIRVSFAGDYMRFDDTSSLAPSVYDFAFSLILCSDDYTICSPIWQESLVDGNTLAVSTSFDTTIGSVLRLSGSVGLADTAFNLALPAGQYRALIYGEQSLNLTLSPVPEIDTWAMLLVGIGLVGLRLRSRVNPAKRITYWPWPDNPY